MPTDGLKKDGAIAPKLIWVGPSAAPYRFPLWQALGRDYSLSVFTYDQNGRSRKWKLPTASNFVFRQLKSFQWGGVEKGFTLGIPPAQFFTGRWSGAIVMGPTCLPSWIVLLKCRLSGIPAVVFYESTSISSARVTGKTFREFFTAVFLKLAGRVCVPGESAYLHAQKLTRGKCKIKVTGNSIDAELFSTLKNSSTEGGLFTFGFLGGREPRKNLSLVLEAFMNAQSNVGLILGGIDSLDQPQPLGITRRIIDGRLQTRGFLQGPDLLQFYTDIDVLIMPSSREVWGMVAHEAVLAGKGVIVSEFAGVAAELKGEPGVRLISPDLQSLKNSIEAFAAEGRVRYPLRKIESLTPEVVAYNLASALKMEGNQ